MNHPNIVNKRKIGDQVLTLLRKDIMLREIEPGTHLKESVLSREYGVSRGPIREAIAQLEKEGLVHTPSNGRTLVEGYSLRDIENLYSSRSQIEKYALSEINYNSFLRSEAELQYCIHLMEKALFKKEKEVDADLQFHYLLVSFSQNKTLIQVWKSLFELLKTVIHVTQEFTMSKEVITIEHHKQIVRGLKERSIEKAQMVLEEHILSANKFYKDAVAELYED